MDVPFAARLTARFQAGASWIPAQAGEQDAIYEQTRRLPAKRETNAMLAVAY